MSMPVMTLIAVLAGLGVCLGFGALCLFFHDKFTIH